MKVIIDIPDGTYKKICELKEVWDEEPKVIMCSVTAHGIPLEKELEDIKAEIDKLQFVHGELYYDGEIVKLISKTAVLDIIDKHCGKEKE